MNACIVLMMRRPFLPSSLTEHSIKMLVNHKQIISLFSKSQKKKKDQVNHMLGFKGKRNMHLSGCIEIIKGGITVTNFHTNKTINRVEEKYNRNNSVLLAHGIRIEPVSWITFPCMFNNLFPVSF